MSTSARLRSIVITIALVICSALAFAQTSNREAPRKPLNAAELEQQASAVSLEQAILRAAASKLREDKTPAGTVELRVRVSSTSLPGPCYDICVLNGTKWFCLARTCRITN